MTRKSALVLAIFLLCGLLSSRPGLAVTPYDDVMVQQAVQNIQQENYDEAVALLTEAWKKGARTPEKAFLLGQTYRLMLNYPKAREFLEEALRLKPNFPQAQLMLADTLLALDKSQEAVPILQKLEATGYEPGQMAFLLGMALVKAGKYSEALDYFRKAQQDPKVAQEAAFQASLALAALNRLKEARSTMEKAIVLNPETPTADFAKRYMGLLEKRLDEIRPFRFGASVGVDYDTNVTLQPGGGGATQVAGQGDLVYTQTATAEYNLFAGKPFNLLAQYSYYENFHRRIPTYDMLSHFCALIPTYNFKSARFWLPLSYNYADVQSDKYYVGYLATPTLLYLLNPTIGLEVGARYNRKYYWMTHQSLSQDDRSGKNFGGSLGAYYFFKQQKGFFQLRFSYEHDSTTGTNWDCNTFRMLLAVLYPVTDKLRFNAFLDMYLQPFEQTFYNGATVGNIAGNPLIPNPKRDDQVLITGVQVSYEIIKRVEFNVHYFFTRDKSNISLYNYSRNIFGCQLGFRY
jgi:tetratricopeptide (TPR) repeat protein